MKITFLGTGTSTGIPQIGCQCETCQSVDLKDKRLRASVLIESNDLNILIDCGPDLRQQLLKHKIRKVDSILITHEHYDHVGGLDDVRPLGEVAVCGEKKVLHVIQRNMPYCFSAYKYPGVPALKLQEIDMNPFEIGDLRVIPVRVMHANLPILGFRLNNVAYLTDVKSIEEGEFEKLKNLDILIINALRIKQHISHINLEEAIVLAKKVGAARTYFTHLSHDMGKHNVIDSKLPDNMFIAYDDLEVEA